MGRSWVTVENPTIVVGTLQSQGPRRPQRSYISSFLEWEGPVWSGTVPGVRETSLGSSRGTIGNRGISDG